METKWASNPFSFKIGNTGLYITDGDGGTRSRDFKADKPLPLRWEKDGKDGTAGMDWKFMGTRINSVMDRGKQSKFDYSHTEIVGNYIQTCDGNDVVHGCVRVSFSYNADVGAAFIGNTGVGGKTEPMNMPASWGCPKSTWFVTKRLASKADIKPGKEVKEDIIATQNQKNESSLYLFPRRRRPRLLGSSVLLLVSDSCVFRHHGGLYGDGAVHRWLLVRHWASR